jgi:hypothetical protein
MFTSAEALERFTAQLAEVAGRMLASAVPVQPTEARPAHVERCPGRCAPDEDDAALRRARRILERAGI